MEKVTFPTRYTVMTDFPILFYRWRSGIPTLRRDADRGSGGMR